MRTRRGSIAILAAMLMVGVTFSGGGCDNPAGGIMCPPPEPSTCPAVVPRYAEVAGILDRKCASCHFESADPETPWPLTTYPDVKAWGDLIRTDTLNCSMPPADSGLFLTPAEATVLLTWIKCGTPN